MTRVAPSHFGRAGGCSCCCAGRGAAEAEAGPVSPVRADDNNANNSSIQDDQGPRHPRHTISDARSHSGDSRTDKGTAPSHVRRTPSRRCGDWPLDARGGAPNAPSHYSSSPVRGRHPVQVGAHLGLGTTAGSPWYASDSRVSSRRYCGPTTSCRSRRHQLRSPREAETRRRAARRWVSDPFPPRWRACAALSACSPLRSRTCRPWCLPTAAPSVRAVPMYVDRGNSPHHRRPRLVSAG
jgi:hypothetical protein